GIVGVTVVEFLDHPDGTVEPGLPLRRDLARAVRVHRPDVVLTINHRDTWGTGAWNHVDHRVVGVAVLDAVRDADNPWVFGELLDDGLEPWHTRFVAVGGSTEPTHFVDVSDWIEAGVASLAAHATYLEGLGEAGTDPDSF